MDGVVPLGERAIDVHELEPGDLEPALLVPREDATDQLALDAVGLDQDEGSFGLRHVDLGYGGAGRRGIVSDRDAGSGVGSASPSSVPGGVGIGRVGRRGRPGGFGGFALDGLARDVMAPIPRPGPRCGRVRPSCLGLQAHQAVGIAADQAHRGRGHAVRGFEDGRSEGRARGAMPARTAG